MTNKTYSKEEQFLRELAQVCKKYKTDLVGDSFYSIAADGVEIYGIDILAGGRYAGNNIKGKVE